MSYEIITYRVPEFSSDATFETPCVFWALEAEDKAKGAAECWFYRNGGIEERFPMKIEVLHKGEWFKFLVEHENVPQFTAYKEEA